MTRKAGLFRPLITQMGTDIACAYPCSSVQSVAENSRIQNGFFSCHFVPFLSAAALAEENRGQKIHGTGYFKKAGIFSPAIICSKVSRTFTSSKAEPLTSTSAGIERVLYRLAIT